MNSLTAFLQLALRHESSEDKEGETSIEDGRRAHSEETL